MHQVAIITGGASGMGFAVGESLAAKGWHVHLVDRNEEAASKASRRIHGSSSYSQADVSSFESVRAAFDLIHREFGEINFVFANAGIGERANFYCPTDADGILRRPSELDSIIDIDLKSVINTVHIAKHYMRQNRPRGHACIVMNASIAGIYPVKFCPIYTAAKHGVVGFARAVAPIFFEQDSIRVNTLCPGNVRTDLFAPDEWDVFKMEWISLSQIVKTVEILLLDPKMQGKVCEVAPNNHYFIDNLPYKDENVRKTLDVLAIQSIGK